MSYPLQVGQLTSVTNLKGRRRLKLDMFDNMEKQEMPAEAALAYLKWIKAMEERIEVVKNSISVMVFDD